MKEIVLDLLPDITITLSSEVLPEFREYERASTTVISAYIRPSIERYINKIHQFLSASNGKSMWIMQSNGGTLPASLACQQAARLLLSGPAAGVTAAVHVASQAGMKNLITLDMGGTSADVCLVSNLHPEVTTDAQIDGLPIKVPMFDMVTVGAGGGSIAWADGLMLQVGPQSAGADPGPACYGRGGSEATVTDAFVVLGRIRPGVTAHWLGAPDVGLITLTEMVDNASRLVQAVKIPVIVDADTGYGNAINVIRTVRLFFSVGVAAVQLEDQVFPKRCGHVAGREVIPLVDAVGKIRAADAARRDTDHDGIIIARTDARGAVGGGLEEAIRRGQAYAQAGADVIFVEGLLSEDEISTCAKEIPSPLLYNMAGVSPRVDFDRLHDLGVKLVIIPGLHHRVAARAMWDATVQLRDFGAQGVSAQDAPQGHPLESFHSFIGFDYVRHLENEFLPADEVSRKYDSPSIGYMPEGGR